MKSLKRLAALATSTALAITMGAPAFAQAASNEVTKDENVFVLLNSDGSIRQQIVSDWLHSDNGLAGVTDRTALTGIENLKGDAAPIQDGGTLVWDTQENDVYYQGVTEQTPPVTAQLRWELDGCQQTAEELQGKDGHLTLTITLANHEAQTKRINGTERTVYTPFVTVAAVDLPTGTFRNVKAAHGTVQTDSSNQLACFIAMPGMSKTFDGVLTGKLKQLEDYFLDEIVVEADVKNFTMPSILLASATSLEELKQDVDLPSLDSSLNALEGATAQLQSGVDQLGEATQALDGKMAEFASSYSAFDAGVDAALAGAKQVQSGAESLRGGAQNLTAATGSLAEGTTALSEGTSALQQGSAALNQKLEGELTPALSAAMEQKTVLEADMKTLFEAIGALKDGTVTLPEDAVQSVTQTVSSQFEAVGSAVASAAAGAAVGRAAPPAASAAAGIAAGAAVAAVNNSVASALQGYMASLPEDQQAVVQGALGVLTDPNNQAAVEAQVANDVAAALAGPDAQAAIAAAAANAVGSAEGQAAIAAAVQGDAGVQAAQGGASQAIAQSLNELAPVMINSVLNRFEGDMDRVKTEAAALLAGVDQLAGALYNAQDPAALNTVSGAVAALASGAQSVNGGAVQLQSGTAQLKDGAAQLQAGTQQLSTGAQSLTDGLSRLSASSKMIRDAIGQFKSGTSQLAGGAGTLRSGFGLFREKTAGALDGLDADALESTRQILEALEEQAEGFSSYTGAPEGVRASVKFVMKVMEPEQPDAQTAQPEAGMDTQEDAGLWGRIKDLFSFS